MREGRRQQIMGLHSVELFRRRWSVPPATAPQKSCTYLSKETGSDALVRKPRPRYRFHLFLVFFLNQSFQWMWNQTKVMRKLHWNGSCTLEHAISLGSWNLHSRSYPPVLQHPAICRSAQFIKKLQRPSDRNSVRSRAWVSQIRANTFPSR